MVFTFPVIGALLEFSVVPIVHPDHNHGLNTSVELYYKSIIHLIN